MGLSWHEKDYAEMVEEMEDHLRIVYGHVLDEQDVHGIVGHMVNVMIDHGAVDPT